MRRRGLSPQQLADAAQLYTNGTPTAELASAFDVDERTMCRSLREHGLTLRGPPGRPLTTALGVSQGAEEIPALRTVVNNMPGHKVDSANAIAETTRSEEVDPLREQAHQPDAEHWNLYQRPISADTLRRKLGVGARRARHIRQHHQPRAQAAVERIFSL